VLIIIFLAPICALVFIAYFYFAGRFVIKPFYQEVWQAKANDYQALPEARLKYGNLLDTEYKMYSMIDMKSKVPVYNNPDVEIRHLIGIVILRR
jgi:hypothetical protein